MVSVVQMGAFGFCDYKSTLHYIFEKLVTLCIKTVFECVLHNRLIACSRFYYVTHAALSKI